MIKANSIINELRDLNYHFMLNNRNGAQIDNKNYVLKKGEIPILLSAPHAVRQYREGQVKIADYLTGPLAMYLAQKCNCSYMARVCNDNDDPNYPLGVTLENVDNEYLAILRGFLQESHQLLMVDLHGCSNAWPHDLSMWSDNYGTCDEEIIKLFASNFSMQGLSFDSGEGCLGGQVTRQAALITNAFQLEVKRTVRSLEEQNYASLKSFLDAVEKSIYETYDYSRKLERVRGNKR